MRKILIVGLLEDIQTQSLNGDVPLGIYEQWLGPETAVGWKAVIDLWNVITPDEFNRLAT